MFYQQCDLYATMDDQQTDRSIIPSLGSLKYAVVVVDQFPLDFAQRPVTPAGDIIFLDMWQFQVQ